ncbi:MAG: SufD family Fe-S cluster assembly protein [Rikenellaceae bacterium]
MSSGFEIINISQNSTEIAVTTASTYKIEGKGAVKFVVADGVSVEIVDFSSECNLEIDLGSGSYAKVVSLKYNESKNRYFVQLLGEGSDVDIYGVTVGKESENISFVTYIKHLKSHTESGQKIKCIGAASSSTLFEGTVYIAEGTAAISAEQQNKNLLLSDSARIKSNPWLEIYADDVKCSHGSTTGMLNEEEIFYMRQRGISLENARKLQIESFAVDILENIGNRELLEAAEQIIVDEIHDVVL